MKNPKKKKDKHEIKIRQKHKAKQIIIILLLIMCTFSIVSILARYTKNILNNFYFRSKEFYFYSDKLKESEAYYQLNNWSGVDDYTITINMNSYKNNLLTTSYDIDYEISYTCSNNVICQLSKTEGTIYKESHTDFFNLTLTPNTTLNTGDRVWVQITAKSKSYYEKTLKATFSLEVGKEKLSYEIQDAKSSPYLELKLTNTLTYYYIAEEFDSYQIGEKIDVDNYLKLSNENKNKCYSAWVTIEFNPEQVLLDMTNTNYLNATSIGTTNIKGYEYINTLTFKIDALSSSNVRFYKKDILKDYTYPGGSEPLIFTIENRD